LEFIHVLVCNSQFLKLSELGVLNALDFLPFILDLLSDLLALLQIVKSVLFLLLLIVGNLFSNSLGVVNESLPFLLLNSLFLSLLLFLSFNLVHVVFSLNAGLLSQT
jgi:prepilin signal peptidase PulO-like enzyme (type II secretory pathway)